MIYIYYYNFSFKENFINNLHSEFHFVLESLFHFEIITRLERILLDKGDDVEEIIAESTTKKKGASDTGTSAYRFHFSYFRYRRGAGNLIDRGEREKERGIIALIRPWPLEPFLAKLPLVFLSFRPFCD